MIGRDGQVLYVGKAKNLKKRVSSYFQRALDKKTTQLVSLIDHIEVTVTRHEREALLLESRLIHSLKPRYNVLFKDDKSYPYIYINTVETFPKMVSYRGARKAKGHYFGPYPSVRLVKDSLAWLQRLFRLRQCSDHFFRNRTRPCLQYQIQRCSAPCVGLISQEAYQQDVQAALQFFQGHNNKAILSGLIERMETASAEQAYERAAMLRDQIAALHLLQDKQIVIQDRGESDVIGVAWDEALCLHLLYIREGQIVGSRQYIQLLEGNLGDVPDWIESFIMQHYVEAPSPAVIPHEIIVAEPLPHAASLEGLLSERAGRRVQIKKAVRTKPSGEWLRMAERSARQALVGHTQRDHRILAGRLALQEVLGLSQVPNRIACFDVSHTAGEATVAACVVFDERGPLKSAYRRFNLPLSKPDDYQGLRLAMTRYLKRLKLSDGPFPDILMVDGGKGQLKVAETVLEELQVTDVRLVALAKGPARKAGRETIYVSPQAQVLALDLSSMAMQLMLQIRDEAHRFAIKAHRQQRGKQRVTSTLEGIPGVGEKRRREILRYLGGMQEVLQASAEELAKVPGISQALAERIYAALHPEGLL